MYKLWNKEIMNVTVAVIQDRHRGLHVPAVYATGQTAVRSPWPLQLWVKPAFRLISFPSSTHTSRELTQTSTWEQWLKADIASFLFRSVGQSALTIWKSGEFVIFLLSFFLCFFCFFLRASSLGKSCNMKVPLGKKEDKCITGGFLVKC